MQALFNGLAATRKFMREDVDLTGRPLSCLSPTQSPKGAQNRPSFEDGWLPTSRCDAHSVSTPSNGFICL